MNKPLKEQSWVHPLHARGVRCSMRGMGNQVRGELSNKRIRELLEKGHYGEDKRRAWLAVKEQTLRKERLEKETLKKGKSL